MHNNYTINISEFERSIIKAYKGWCIWIYITSSKCEQYKQRVVTWMQTVFDNGKMWHYIKGLNKIKYNLCLVNIQSV